LRNHGHQIVREENDCALARRRQETQPESSTESSAVLKALGAVSVQGPRGTIAMSKQHHAPLSMYLGQVQGDGSVKVIQSFPSVDPGEQCPNLKS